MGVAVKKTWDGTSNTWRPLYTDTKRRDRPRRFVAGLLGALALACAVAGVLLSTLHINDAPNPRPTPSPDFPTDEPTEPTESSPAATPNQTTFLEDVSQDRKTLVPGGFQFPDSASSAVGRSTSIPVKLWMEEEGPGRTGPPTPPPAGSKIGYIPVGGVEGASLTSPSNEVEIRPLFDSSVKQIVTQPTDQAEWEWAVSASKPGKHKLVLRITTYQGESNRALATSRPVTIHFRVTNTVSHSVNWVRGELVAWGGVAAAVVAIVAFRTPLLALLRARRDSLIERQRQGTDGYM